MCLTCCLPRFTDSFFDSPNCSILDIDPKAANDEVKSDIVNGLSQYANTQIVSGHLNINSLPGKFAEMQEWIEVFDIFSVQETKIDKTFPGSQFALKGYNMYRRDRKKGSGGILL